MMLDTPKSPQDTLPKNEILNWLFLTDRNVSIEKLGQWLEANTNVEYKIVKGHQSQTSSDSLE